MIKDKNGHGWGNLPRKSVEEINQANIKAAAEAWFAKCGKDELSFVARKISVDR